MRKLLLFLFLILVVIVVGLGVFGSIVWGRMNEPFKGYTTVEQFVEIPQGSGTQEIGRRLVNGGVVRDLFVFRAALWWTGRARNLQAGEYRFAEPLSAAQVIDQIARGAVYTHRITFPEGLTILEMSKLYESHGFGPARDFVTAAGNAALVADIDPAAPDLEGYLFPETYAIARGTPASRLVALMVERFRAAYPDTLRKEAESQGLSTRQVMTLASLVEKETGKPEERPLVAAVYRNRHRVGMGMQADPTVIYALQKAGRYDGNIRRADLDIDSPYNTYRYPGLPPGPIASPGQASLEATVRPAAVTYLYFVSRNDGSHAFATTLAEHNRNVQKFQILYFREKRLRERGQ
jgi:UPF0755 protein